MAQKFADCIIIDAAHLLHIHIKILNI